MQVTIHTEEHQVTPVGAPGPDGEPVQAVCSCLAQWSSRNGDPRHPTFAEWGLSHRPPLTRRHAARSAA